MTNDTELTPQNTGTEAIQTPGDGTAAGQAAGGDSTPPPQTDYQKKFAESTREAQRLYAHNQQLSGAVASLQQQIQQLAAQRQPTPQVNNDPNPASLYAEFSDAVLDRKPETIAKVLDGVQQRAERNVMERIAQAGSQQQRLQGSLAYVTQELKDPNSALARESMKRYSEIVNDPYYNAMVQPDQTNIGGIMVNPHLLRIAVTEAKAKVGGNSRAIEAQARDEMDHFTEPSQPAAKIDKSKFDAQKHLTEDERAAAKDLRMSYESYWKNMDKPGLPSLREARLKSGTANLRYDRGRIV